MVVYLWEYDLVPSVGGGGEGKESDRKLQMEAFLSLPLSSVDCGFDLIGQNWAT